MESSKVYNKIIFYSLTKLLQVWAVEESKNNEPDKQRNKHC